MRINQHKRPHSLRISTPGWTGEAVDSVVCCWHSTWPKSSPQQGVVNVPSTAHGAHSAALSKVATPSTHTICSPCQLQHSPSPFPPVMQERAHVSKPQKSRKKHTANAHTHAHTAPDGRLASKRQSSLHASRRCMHCLVSSIQLQPASKTKIM